jgi:hypothetical protein
VSIYFESSAMEIHRIHGFPGTRLSGTSDRALRVLLDGVVVTPVAFTTADLRVLAHIVFDTGASLAISLAAIRFFDPTPLAKTTTPGGMGKGLQIEGVGTVAWAFTAKDKSEIQLRLKSYYVPAAKARLLSPQKLFNKKSGVYGHFYGDEDTFTLQVGNLPVVEVPYCRTSGLPIGEALCGEKMIPQSTNPCSTTRTQICHLAKSYCLSGTIVLDT